MKQQLFAALVVLLVTVVSAFGGIALILSALFFNPIGIINFIPLIITLYFFFQKRYKSLYITAGVFLAVVGLLLITNLPESIENFKIGGWLMMSLNP